MRYRKSINKQARLTGLLYLLASIPASFCLIYVPNKLIVLNDATATADRVRASESLLRLQRNHGPLQLICTPNNE